MIHFTDHGPVVVRRLVAAKQPYKAMKQIVRASIATVAVLALAIAQRVLGGTTTATASRDGRMVDLGVSRGDIVARYQSLFTLINT